jgi:hypothetical protein
MSIIIIISALTLMYIIQLMVALNYLYNWEWFETKKQFFIAIIPFSFVYLKIKEFFEDIKEGWRRLK